MEETRGITFKVVESLHTKAKQEAEANSQTMAQFMEAVLKFYFNREEQKEMNTNKRTLAFQVSEEFFAEVQEYIRAHNLKLKDFGMTAMRRMMDETAPTETEAAAEIEAPDEAEAQTEPETTDEAGAEPEAESEQE